MKNLLGLTYSLIFFGIFFSPLFNVKAWAQTSAVSTNQISLGIKQIEMLDPQIITDKKMQADEGSLSRYSVKFTLAYAGPGIGDLDNKNQPNMDGIVSSDETKISGSIGARYRLNGVSTISLGTGIAAIHPFHGWERTDINNPYLGYDRSSRFGNLQMRNMISGSHVTNPTYRRVGEVAGISYGLDLVHGIGDSRFSVGLDSRFDYYFFNRRYEKRDRKTADYYLSFYPGLKYQVSDKMNLNTSFSISHTHLRQFEDRYALTRRTLTQRIGMGYSYKRDVYFSPYITTYPEYLKASNTTFNLAATFSAL